jgi:Gpi18-like mannosyltransferase
LVSLSYIIDAFFTVLTALLCWKVLNGQHKYIYASAIIIALAGGFRQNTIVFLAPLWLFSIRKVPIRMIVISALLMMAVVSMWFIPMIILAGWACKVPNGNE